jgi:hypothetical protein
MFKKLFALCALSMVCAVSFADARLIVNRVVMNPKGGPNVGGTTDPSSGLEMIEIKNVGDASINLGTNNVAVVTIDNERAEGGELDSYYRLTGTLPAGGVMLIRDLNSGGTVTSVTGPTGSVAYASILSDDTQWTPDSGGTPTEDYELENSGAEFLIVKGFNATNAAAKLGVAMDTNNDLKLDWVATATTADDLWTPGNCEDAFVVYPGDDTFGDYTAPATSGLTFANRVVSAPTNTEATGDFTADYAFRLYRVDGTARFYDDAIAVDLDTYSGTLEPMEGNLNSTLEFRSFSGYGTAGSTITFRTAADVTITGSITGYVIPGKYGNWTNNTTFDHLKINGTNYYH